MEVLKMAINQEEMQNEIMKVQQIQQQLQQIIQQKQQLETRKNDLERALEEINKLDDESRVYKNIGEEILVQVEDRKDLTEEIEDDLESSEVRVKSLSRQEEKLRKKFQELQQKLTSQMGGMQQGPVDSGEN